MANNFSSSPPSLYRSTSNQPAPSVRIARLKAFLPLSEEGTYSTRGQKLPNILRNRSAANLNELQRHNSASNPRRQSSIHRSREDSDLEHGHHDDGAAIELPLPPPDFPLPRPGEDRRPSAAGNVLLTPQMRSQRLIGNSNPRYEWKRYFKTEEQLKEMNKPLRKYYERNNYLIQQYEYIDRLLDSSLPHDLIQEYGDHDNQIDVPPTIHEEDNSFPNHSADGSSPSSPKPNGQVNGTTEQTTKLKRTPRDLYRVIDDESTPLLNNDAEAVAAFQPEDDGDDDARIVTVAIYLNLVANTILLILKIIVTVLTDSLSVLASLVDAALDFLSTAIVWTTTTIISRSDKDIQNFPVGRRRLEPIGVLVFSVIMITSFFQVALQAIQALMGSSREVVALTVPAVAIMASTVIIKFGCWLWCRLIRNSSVQALAQDAMTDVVFNIFSIIFPLIGYFGNIWWLDPLGGLLLSLYVITAWSFTTRIHILNLTGRAASADERNILLYLTMRFAHTIKHIQGLTAYHAGDKLNVEVDIVLDSEMSLQDSHDLGESLQYVLESVPGVERAFVHADYKRVNLPSHMKQ